MKIVINTCFGGFNLSRKAVKRMAELQGRECFIFINDYKNKRFIFDDDKTIFWVAFDIPNPNKVLYNNKIINNTLYKKHCISNKPDTRTDLLLIQVVEELGKEANGSYSELKVIEIPDGIEYEIEEYDGNEYIAEKHRTWS